MIFVPVEAEKAGLAQGAPGLNAYDGLGPKYPTGFLLNRNSGVIGSREQAPGGWLHSRMTAAASPVRKGSASR
jgi:hypothetical protein